MCAVYRLLLAEHTRKAAQINTVETAQQSAQKAFAGGLALEYAGDLLPGVGVRLTVQLNELLLRGGELELLGLLGSGRTGGFLGGGRGFLCSGRGLLGGGGGRSRLIPRREDHGSRSQVLRSVRRVPAKMRMIPLLR